MPSSQTPNHQLNQWSRDDRILMEDFNADNAKIDAAIAEKVSIVTGSYKGDEQESRFIDLGFTPQAVLLFKDNGATYNNSSYCGGLALPDRPVRRESYPILSVVEGGFMVYNKFVSNDKIVTNSKTYTYHYIAFK